MSALSILINVGASTAQAVREIDKVGGALQSNLTGAEKFSKGVKSAAVPATLAFAAISAGAMSSVKAAEEAAATSAKLTEVYDSMGYKDLADDAEAYAESLSKQIGVDDDIIKGAQTKLATFSEVAKSADTMAKATSLAADLAAAGFGSMDSASVMLGKALNDPIKGVTALGKAGVTFTEQQKDQIKAMVKAGDVAGAQGIIMEEVGKQVGGVAEAGATSSQKIGVAFGEIGESVGAILLPAFEKIAPAIQTFATWAQENAGPLTVIGGVIAVVAGVIIALNVAMTIATAVTTAWGIAVAIATSPITLIVLAILAVIAVVVLLYKNWDTVIAWLKSAWVSVKNKAIEIWGSLKEWFKTTWDSIKTKLVEAWEGIKGAVSSGIDSVVSFVKGLPGKVVSGIGSLTSTLTQKGKDLLTGLWEGAKSVWTNITEWVGGLVGRAKEALGNVGSALFNKGKDLIQGFVNGIKSMGGAILSAILSILPNSIEGIVRRAIGFSAPIGSGGAVAGRSLGGSSRRSVGNVVINLYGDPVANERAVKRALEGYDVSMGRSPGQKLARAW